MTALCADRLREAAYRTYVTDSLRLAPQGMYKARRWADLMEASATADDGRTAEEIVAHVIESGGLEEVL